MVRAQDGSEVQFKVRVSMYLGKVFYAYRQKKWIHNTANFMYEGSVLEDFRTFGSYGMEDGDMVDMMLEQLGD